MRSYHPEFPPYDVRMTVVLVHGIPETAAVWDPIVPLLDQHQVVRLSPPGFGASVPAGFGATVTEYRDWLIRELETSGAGPVDLVGHDWGGGHVLGVALVRPDLVRSWAIDVMGVFHPEYVWHDLARVWQEPEAGERAMARMLARPGTERAAGLAGLGMNAVVAERVAAGMDETMADCILRLYPSAAQPAMARIGAELGKAAARPGLALVPAEDHMAGTERQHREAAARAGARMEILPGLGHWWMTQDPARGAKTLHRFWSSL